MFKLDNLGSELNKTNFQINLAFLTDLTEYQNNLNGSLQGKNKHIFELISHINGFKNKLKMLHSAMQKKKNSTTLKEPKSFLRVILILPMIISTNSQHNLETALKISIKKYADLYLHPTTCNVTDKPIQFQSELCDLQADLNLLPFRCAEEFWKNVSLEN